MYKYIGIYFSVDIVPYCHANPNDIVPKLDSCAQYYICSKVTGNVAIVEECPYPDLFSRSLLQCGDFESVDCDRRPEPQAPCETQYILVGVFKCRFGDLMKILEQTNFVTFQSCKVKGMHCVLCLHLELFK